MYNRINPEAIRTHRTGTYRFDAECGDSPFFAVRIRAAATKCKELAISMPQGGILEGEANSLNFKALRLERGGLENWQRVLENVMLIEHDGAIAVFAQRGYKL